MYATTTGHRVALGARLLDEVKPGWFDRVNLDDLNLSSASVCILGQLYGTYSQGAREVFGTVQTTYDHYDVEKSMSHGFSTRGNDWDDLQREWVKAINARRNPLADWERELLEGGDDYNTHTQADVDAALARGRSEGITAYREALDRVDSASRLAGLNLSYAEVVALTSALDLL